MTSPKGIAQTRKEFNLTEIFLDDEAREEFLRDLTWVGHL